MNIDLKLSIPKTGDYDLIVVGGGVAGVAAAVNASRFGMNTLLIEKSVNLGGLATTGLVNFFVPMCNGRGTQIIKGMAEEMLQLSKKYSFDTVPSDWQTGEPGEGKTMQRYTCRYSAPIYMLALTEFLSESGADLLLDTVLCDVVCENGRIKGVITNGKSGFQYYEAKMFIDASGDSDLLHLAGVPTVQGKNYHTYYAFGTNLENCQKAISEGDVAHLYKMYPGGKANLYGKFHPEGHRYWLGTSNRDVTDYIVENQLELLSSIKGDNRKERDITILPAMPQLRTTRRIDGDYTLCEDDVYRHFDDSVGAICDFDRRDYLYEIPFRCLTKSGYPNVIAAGRCASGTGYAWDVLRVIPPAIITGQASAAACFIALRDNESIYNVNIKELQALLEGQNVMIHFDDSLIKEDGGEKADIGHI